ncbi:MAG: hypothetical protein R8G66_06210 [Cytophagales bacterium]|nr:hypothetical protein [Cytophagales bacterium]
MDELKLTSSILSNQMITLIDYIRKMETTMDERLFSYTTIVSQFVGILNNLHEDSPRSLNDILTDLVSMIMPLAHSSEMLYQDAQYLVSAIMFKHKGRDTISAKAFDLLHSNASLIKDLETDNKTLIRGALYTIKDENFVILGPLALGTDYWIYDQTQLDQRKVLASVPAHRLSDLLPLNAADFRLKGFLQSEFC